MIFLFAFSTLALGCYFKLQRLAVLGHETINTPIYCQMDQNLCHVMTETLGRYSVIGEPIMTGKAMKILRLAAFATSLPAAVDFNMRVYFIEDTQDALEVSIKSNLPDSSIELVKKIIC